MSSAWWVIVLTGLVWLVFDIYIYLKGKAQGGTVQAGNAGTLSVALDWLFTHFKAASFLFGFLIGHLAWQVHICP